MAKQTIVDLPEGWVVYSNLDKPHAWNDSDKPRYGLTVAWPASEYDSREGPWPEVKRAFHEAAVAKFGSLANQRKDGQPPYRVPFRRGEEHGKDPDRFRGYVVGSFRSEYEIPVGESLNGAVARLDAGAVERGMRVVVAVKPRGYKTSWSGVSAYAHAVLVVGRAPDAEFLERTGGSGAVDAVTHFSSRGYGSAEVAPAAPEGVADASLPGDDIPF